MTTKHGTGGIAIVWGEAGTQLLTAVPEAMPYEYLGVYTGRRYVWQSHRYIQLVDKRDLPGLVALPDSADAFSEIAEFRRQQDETRRKEDKKVAKETDHANH
jgi:hypothetical protein